MWGGLGGASIGGDASGDGPLISVPPLSHEIKIVAYRMPEADRRAIDDAAQQYWDLLIQQEQGRKLNFFQFTLMTKLRVWTEHHKVETLVQLTLAGFSAGLSVLVMVKL